MIELFGTYTAHKGNEIKNGRKSIDVFTITEKVTNPFGGKVFQVTDDYHFMLLGDKKQVGRKRTYVAFDSNDRGEATVFLDKSFYKEFAHLAPAACFPYMFQPDTEPIGTIEIPRVYEATVYEEAGADGRIMSYKPIIEEQVQCVVVGYECDIPILRPADELTRAENIKIHDRIVPGKSLSVIVEEIIGLSS